MEPQNKILSKIVAEQIINLNRIGQPDSPSHCGYCDQNGSYSYGLLKDQMHPYVYQLLAQRGWRRCGTYYYKPDLKKSCCKLWTHRQDVTNFSIKKDQKKTIRKLMKIYYKSAVNKVQQPQKQKENQKNKKVEKMAAEIPIETEIKMRQVILRLIDTLQKRMKQFISLFENALQQNIQGQKHFQFKGMKEKLKLFISAPNAEADYYCNFVMILFGVNKKIFKKDYKNTDFVKDIKDWVLDVCKGQQFSKSGLDFDIERSGYFLFKEVKQKQVSNKQQRAQKKEKQKIQYKEKGKKQGIMKQKTEKMENQNLEQVKYEGQFFISSDQIRFGQLLIKMAPAELTKDGWKLYQQYCQKIHQKPQKSQSSYKGFLCQKALKFMNEETDKNCDIPYTPSWDAEGVVEKGQKISGKRRKKLGCYHMNYYLKGELIGVGVVDFLPDGLSSVYFFYHPRFKDQRLGVFSSLIQIEYVRWMSLSFPEFKNYYMGFYIQNNHKMSYKGDYEPFCLLCPVSYRFVQFTAGMRQLVQKIQKKQVQSVQLAQNPCLIDDMNFQGINLINFLAQKTKIRRGGREFLLKTLKNNENLFLILIQILNDMIKVWGKELFNMFVFTF